MSDQSTVSNATENAFLFNQSMSMPQRIAVLMCTLNGEAYLEAQLASIQQQTCTNIDIWVSDDGSSDGTVNLLNKFKSNWRKGRFEILAGPQRGFAVNFLSLVCNVQIQANYYAYSDQDDIWQLDKLSRAIQLIENYQQIPSLYCSRTHLITELGESMQRKSPRFQRLPSFQNALVQNIAGGNTMVFNDAARDVLLKAGMQKIISHDWWTYIIIAGSGGQVIYDPEPSVAYRQHSDNQIGANIGFIARVKRLGSLLKGNFSDWNSQHIKSLDAVRQLIRPVNQNTLDAFAKARRSGLNQRLVLMKKSKVYRQTLEGNIALWIAAILRKI